MTKKIRKMFSRQRTDSEVSGVSVRGNAVQVVILHPSDSPILMFYHRFLRNCFLSTPFYIFCFSVFSLSFFHSRYFPFLFFFSYIKYCFALSAFHFLSSLFFFRYLSISPSQNIKRSAPLYLLLEEASNRTETEAIVDARGPRVIPSSYLSFRGPPSGFPPSSLPLSATPRIRSLVLPRSDVKATRILSLSRDPLFPPLPFADNDPPGPLPPLASNHRPNRGGPLGINATHTGGYLDY